ncbi:hypothetical protein [Aquimarina sp. 2201CG14-23]|uniref:hypothetical protein n=1 Tax=Aquimarina mycalae TaxID=3040073 RepID=UPI002477CEAC|nr:hypothetical protein [Aquimarina sp. 2201CG14-23]MDH7448055.1 hypothetical protein [Aquimarina sp. 2201CG14-23]
MIKAIKIYGERNSGTNYLEQLIDQNLQVKILKYRPNKLSTSLLRTIKYDFVIDILSTMDKKNSLGWKHGCPRVKEINEFKKHPLVIVTITKNPYSFLLSLHKKPYHFRGKKDPVFHNFIEQDWFLRNRDFCKGRYLESPIELWNVKNKSYIHLSEKTFQIVINITYEQLIKNPEAIIDLIAKKGGIQVKKEEGFQNIVDSTKKSSLTFDDYKNYYLKKEWRKNLNNQAIGTINEKIDRSIIEYFKYQIIQLEM